MGLDGEQEGSGCSAGKKCAANWLVFLHPCHDVCAVSSEAELLRRTNESRAGVDALLSPEYLRAVTRWM